MYITSVRQPRPVKVTIQIHDDLVPLVQQQCPKSLSTTTFCALLLEQGLTGCANVAAYSVGAGNRNEVHAKLPLQFPPDLEVTSSNPPTEAVQSVQPKSWKPKSVNARLTKFESLILEFWRVKKGSKGETAWKRLQGQLEKFLDAYGDSVVHDQLELAINGKWAGIEFSRYEQFKPAKKPWQQEPEMKHPAHRDFTAERIAAERESTENFLGF